MVYRQLVAYLWTVILFGCSTKQNNSPILLMASQNSGPGAAILTLRQDGSCEWIAGMFDSPHEGEFQLGDSVITLEGIDLGDSSKTRRLLLTRKNPNNATIHELILLRLDSNKRIASPHLILNVTVDKR
jgi:hypothetical protein